MHSRGNRYLCTPVGQSSRLLPISVLGGPVSPSSSMSSSVARFLSRISECWTAFWSSRHNRCVPCRSRFPKILYSTLHGVMTALARPTETFGASCPYAARSPCGNGQVEPMTCYHTIEKTSSLACNYRNSGLPVPVAQGLSLISHHIKSSSSSSSPPTHSALTISARPSSVSSSAEPFFPPPFSV